MTVNAEARKPPASAAALPLAAVARSPGVKASRRGPQFLLVLVLLGAAAVATAMLWPRGDASRGARAVVVGPQSRRSAVHALGRLEPRGEVVSVAAPSGAGDSRIATLQVKEGDRIAEGDVVAVLDNAPLLEAAHAVAVAGVEQASAKLRKARTDVSASRDELRAIVTAARARLRTARIKAERESVLLADRATSQDAFDDATLELERATHAIVENEARLARYLEAADGRAVDVAVAEAHLAVARATLAEAEANLARSRVLSPVSGLVLDLTLRAGEPVAGATLMEVGAVDEMMVRLDIYESDAPQVSPGQAVELSAPALQEPLVGVVETVGSLVKRQSVVDAFPAANTDARVVEAMVRLDDASSRRASRFVEMQVRAKVLVQ